MLYQNIPQWSKHNRRTLMIGKSLLLWMFLPFYIIFTHSFGVDRLVLYQGHDSQSSFSWCACASCKPPSRHLFTGNCNHPTNSSLCSLPGNKPVPGQENMHLMIWFSLRVPSDLAEKNQLFSQSCLAYHPPPKLYLQLTYTTIKINSICCHTVSTSWP